MSATTETTIGEIVAEDFRAAAVFHRFGIDYCCGGRRTVAEACRQRGLAADEVLAEVTRTCTSPDPGQPQVSEWEPETLIAHIVGTHHSYVRRSLPAIRAYLTKLVSVHGVRHPELGEIAGVFDTVTDEMRAHMMKEEEVLFPFILDLASARGCRSQAPLSFSIEDPIRVMEAEHESAGSAMARIRRLANDYVPPADGCTTYRVCMKELEWFEQDLQRHVHLENNVLFPKVRALAVER